MDPAREAGQTPAPPPALPIVRCPIHGIAYDDEREQCPECAKGTGPTPPRPGCAGPRAAAG